MNEGRNAIYRDSTAPRRATVKLLLVHSRDDLRKSNFVVAAHKGVGQERSSIRQYSAAPVHLCVVVIVAARTSIRLPGRRRRRRRRI